MNAVVILGCFHYSIKKKIAALPPREHKATLIKTDKWIFPLHEKQIKLHIWPETCLTWKHSFIELSKHSTENFVWLAHVFEPVGVMLVGVAHEEGVAIYIWKQSLELSNPLLFSISHGEIESFVIIETLPAQRALFRSTAINTLDSTANFRLNFHVVLVEALIKRPQSNQIKQIPQHIFVHFFIVSVGRSQIRAHIDFE